NEFCKYCSRRVYAYLHKKPTYTRTNITNALHGSAGFRTDTQIVTKQKLKSVISESKKYKNIEK
ncbi:MAG: hypothetical protein RR555_10830, partial [Bacteroidales bacterium]